MAGMKRATLLLPLIFVIAWSLPISALYLWDVKKVKRENELLAVKTAEDIYRIILEVRKWNARSERVYVTVSNHTPPNPYLKDPLRDIKVKGFFLTMVNPAYMTRQVAELITQDTGVTVKMMGVKPVNPSNKPSPLEREALKAFMMGKRIFVKNLKEEVFYAAPLFVEKPCLKCHADQGFKVGDLIGGISVRVPLRIARASIYSLTISFLIIWLIGVVASLGMGIKLGRAYSSIEHQAKYDSLTSLLNRGELMKRLSRIFRKTRALGVPLSLALCDVDYFKAYNDTYGHDQGDRCLIEVARTIESSLHRSVDFCGRYGGEEFLIVLPDTTGKGAFSVIERIRKGVEDLKIEHKGSPFGIVTISAGIASTDTLNSVSSYEDLIKAADKALYKAKSMGRNKVQLYRNG